MKRLEGKKKIKAGVLYGGMITEEMIKVISERSKRLLKRQLLKLRGEIY
jgi:hypothetical protein